MDLRHLYSHLALGGLLEDLQLGRAQGEEVSPQLQLRDVGRLANRVEGKRVAVVEEQQDAQLVRGDVELLPPQRKGCLQSTD